MSEPTRPRPSLHEPDTAPFWAACGRHELTYQQCPSCDERVAFRRPLCPSCGGDLVDAISAGIGTVYSQTAIRKHGDPFFRARIPYLVGVIDLDEGFRLLAPLDVGTAEVDRVHIGRRVQVAWEDYESWSMPIFRPLS